MRSGNRSYNELRPVKITRNYTKHAEGSVLVEFGETKVLCNASVTTDYVPRFLKGKNQGWVTAEYGMLPRSTNTRNDREAARGKQTGRTLEIQRLIARSLRAMLDLKKLGENMIIVDCDVLQADGGTRTAAITGGAIALIDAINKMLEKQIITRNPVKNRVAAVSVGILADNQAALDLDYEEDSTAHTDMNIIMNDQGQFIEVQGTAEGSAFSHPELLSMLEVGQQGVSLLLEKQLAVINETTKEQELA